MSGHSKWANIKRKKEKTDAAKGNVFTKIGREIAVAVKLGGSDPNNNSRLADVIAKAKANNMPNDNITRSIKKAAGELGNINYENMTYEGYGIGGSAVIVECLTDNNNRTAGDVRSYFTKYGGSLGTTNCVSFMFDRKGVIVCERSENMTEDQAFELAINAGADDVLVEEEVFEVYTAPTDMDTVKAELINNGAVIMSAEVEWLPQNMVTLNDEQLVKFRRMLDMFEENDDVQNVYHNVDLPDDED
ncbi:MAG: YebC/PmpR family DNA-binding transcriptional regulator [Clostridiales bacterium]|nr:YebC/PmpR family DNA-binding transcriptional regulator [Clostridiales bacterium]